MITFEDITLEGFGSYLEPTKFTLNRPGLNIVIGTNGSGKSHIPSAISWVLFGKALKDTKDVSTWAHVRPKDFKGTRVSLRFNQYELVRYKDYKAKGIDGIKGANRIVLWDGTENILKGTKLENQETLNGILGFNYEVLVNSIIFGQRMRRLIETSGPDKKKVFEEAFNASFIKEARDQASKDHDIKRQELLTLKALLDKNQSIYNLKLSHYKEQKEARKRAQDKKEETLKDFNTELKNLKAQVFNDDLDDQIAICQRKVAKVKAKINKSVDNWVSHERLSNKISNDRNKQDELLETQTRLEKSCQKLLNSIDHYQKEDKKVTCETCGSPLKDIKKARIIKDLKERHKEEEAQLYKTQTHIFNIAAVIESDEKELQEVKVLLDKDKLLESKLNHLEQQIKLLEKENFQKSMHSEYLKSCYARIKAAESMEIPELNPADKLELKALKKEINTQSLMVEGLEDEVKDLNWLINDLLGNKGLKAYIFESMLQKLNQLLVYYEQFIGFRVEFKVDLDSGNKDIYAICYKGEHLIFYEDLSGGQKQLVDAVTTFAMYDLITKDKPTNLLFFDEPFESLSADNIEIVYDLINDKANSNRSIYLITHQIDLQSSSTKVIRMSLTDKGTTLLKSL